MQLPQRHPSSWYSDPAWLRSMGLMGDSIGLGLCATRIKGVPALITPPWALHIGNTNEGSPVEWVRMLNDSKHPLIVCDFPPGHRSDLRAPWTVHTLHTRCLTARDDGEFPAWPNHRTKQLEKAFKKGLKIEKCQDTPRIVRLHQLARKRKSIRSDELKLTQLLSHIVQSPHQSSYVVVNGEGEDVASAVFLHDSGRTVYAFGGQNRTPLSSLATVMLIDAGIRDAQKVGNNIFDFGGSSDAGVDRFYEEFGAQAIYRERAVRVQGLARIWLRWWRPDLFMASS